MRLLPTVALLVSFVAVGPAIAQSADEVNQSLAAIFGESERFEVAFTALQDAVAADDPEAVAALVAYPLVVKVGERREIATPEEFVARYEAIMTEKIEAA